MSDAWETAFSEASAELEGEATTAEPVAAPVEESEPAAEADTSNETVEPEPTTETVAPETVTAPEASWWEQHLDDEIDVNGEKLTLKELQGGYLRQSDYTKKTQQLADFRRAAEYGARVQQGLQRDPVGTLRQMAAELGLIDADQEEFRPDEVDPALEQMHELRQELESLKNDNLLMKVQREIAAVQAKHPDFKEDDVLALAAEYGERGVGLSIEQAYFIWKGMGAREAEEAAERARKRAEEEAARLAAARAQSEQINSGHNLSASDDEREFDSFEDIFAFAWEKAGGD